MVVNNNNNTDSELDESTVTKNRDLNQTWLTCGRDQSMEVVVEVNRDNVDADQTDSWNRQVCGIAQKRFLCARGLSINQEDLAVVVVLVMEM